MRADADADAVATMRVVMDWNEADDCLLERRSGRRYDTSASALNGLELPQYTLLFTEFCGVVLHSGREEKYRAEQTNQDGTVCVGLHSS
jgi:hypothetical protein